MLLSLAVLRRCFLQWNLQARGRSPCVLAGGVSHHLGERLVEGYDIWRLVLDSTCD